MGLGAGLAGAGAALGTTLGGAGFDGAGAALGAALGGATAVGLVAAGLAVAVKSIKVSMWGIFHQ